MDDEDDDVDYDYDYDDAAAADDDNDDGDDDGDDLASSCNGILLKLSPICRLGPNWWIVFRTR